MNQLIALNNQETGRTISLLKLSSKADYSIEQKDDLITISFDQSDEQYKDKVLYIKLIEGKSVSLTDIDTPCASFNMKIEQEGSKLLDTYKKVIKDLKEQLKEKNVEIDEILLSMSKGEQTNGQKSNGESITNKQMDNLKDIINSLKEEINDKDKEIAVYKDKNKKSSDILKQSLDKYKKQNDLLKQAQEELDNTKEQIISQQQNNKTSDTLEENSYDVFALLVQNSLEKLKLTKKIINLKNSNAKLIPSSLEKLKDKVVEKRSEKQSLGEFEDKLKTHFWNIHEVYLGSLVKMYSRFESTADDYEGMSQRYNRYKSKLEYIDDLLQKFVKSGGNETVLKGIFMGLSGAFYTSKVDRTLFITHLKTVIKSF